MKQVKTEEAVGKVLGYDTTYVGKEGATTLLPRGHIITKEDVELLKNSGVYYVWVNEGEEGDFVYEWDITPQVANNICGENVNIVPGKQGSTMLFSKVKGVLTIDVQKLVSFNLNQSVLLITKYNYTPVTEGDLIGVVEVIPFKMKKEDVEKLKVGKIIDVTPFKKSRLGLIITGTEIYEGRKEDQYYPVIKEKANKYGWSIVYKEIVPDDENKIVEAIKTAVNNGAEAVIVTGGTSVDATDKTPIAIGKLGKIISYGLPIKPTTMSIVAMWDSIPIFGISAGGIYYRELNAIDVMFTRLMAGLIPSKEEIALMGHGGILPNFQPKMKLQSMH